MATHRHTAEQRAFPGSPIGRHDRKHPDVAQLPFHDLYPPRVTMRLPGRRSTNTQLRILIADRHEVVRIGVKQILEENDGWLVVAEADNGKSAITQAMRAVPDVAIIDSSLPLINGIEATRQI